MSTTLNLSVQQKAYLAIGGIVLFCAALPTLWLAPLGDEAMYLLQAKLIAQQGWLPYRDFFQFILPASLYLGSMVLKLTGNSVFAVRLLIMGVQISALWALLRVATNTLRPSGQLFLILFIWVSVITMSSGLSHHSLGGALVPWVMFFLLQKNKNSLKISGVLSGLTVITSQVLGVLVTLAALAFLWQQQRPLKQFFLCLFVFPVLLFIQLIISGSLADFTAAMHWLYSGHYLQTTTVGYFVTGFEAIKNSLLVWTNNSGWIFLWERIPTACQLLLVGFLPLLGLGYAFSALKNSFLSTNKPLIILLVFFTVATLLSTASYSTEYHISQVAWPGYLLGVIALQPLLGNNSQRSKVITLLSCLVLGGIVWQRLTFLPVAIQNKSSWIPSYGTQEALFWLPTYTEKINAYRYIIEALHSVPRQVEPVFIWNVSPELYLFSDRTPATRYTFTLPILMSEQQLSETLQTLKNNPPTLMVYDSLLESIGNNDPRYAKYQNTSLPDIEAFTMQHYAILWASGGYTVFIVKNRDSKIAVPAK